MSNVPTTRPKFASEREEAEWWDAHPEYIEQLFEQAERNGTLTRGTAAKRFGLKPCVPVPVILNKEDLDLASAQAQTKGLDVQVYIEALLHEALIDADRR